MSEKWEKLKGPRLYKRAPKRGKLLGIAHEAIDLCRFHIYNSETSPSEKRQWIKTLNGLISTSSKLLIESDIDELEKRIYKLEEEVESEEQGKKTGK